MNKNVPNILTIARIVAVPFFIWFFYKKFYMAAFIIFIAASLTDMLDGYLARKYDLVSNFGKFMDPLADKILTYSAFCLLVEEKIIWAVFLIIVLFREFAVAGIRMLAATKGTVIAADIFGKIKTVLQMISIPLYLFNYATIGIAYLDHIVDPFHRWIGFFAVLTMILSIIMTIISGFNYIFKNIEVLKDDDR